MSSHWPLLIHAEVEASLAADRWEAGVERMGALIEAREADEYGRHALHERQAPPRAAYEDTPGWRSQLRPGES